MFVSSININLNMVAIGVLAFVMYCISPHAAADTISIPIVENKN